MPLIFLLISCDLLDLKKADVGVWCLINAHRAGAGRPRRDAAGRQSRGAARKLYALPPQRQGLRLFFFFF